MKSYRTLAWRELLAQRVTSVLILLAVILSTMMTAVIGQSAGVLSAMRQQQAILLGGDRYATFVQRDAAQVELLRQDPRLSFVGTHLQLGTADLSAVLALSLLEYQEDVRAIYPSQARLKEGRLPEAALEIALPEDVLQYLGLTGALGEPVTLSLSKTLRHGVETSAYDFTAQFTLVGVTESNYLGYAAGLVTGLAGPGTGEALLPEAYIYYSADFRTADKGSFQDTVNDLIAQLNVHELDTIYNIPYLDALGIAYDAGEAYENMAGIEAVGFSFLLAAGLLVGTLLLLAAGLVIYNILKIAVSRRIGQYGVLRAIGGERGQLYLLVTAQVLLLCAVGIPVGLVLGTLSAKGILTAATGLLSPQIFLVQDREELTRLIADNSAGKGVFLLASAAITLLFALAAAIPAARYAARVSPTAAMAGRPVKVKRRSRAAKKIRCFERYCARLNLSRSRGRTAITILSLTMSIAVFITLQGSVSLLDTAGRVTEHLGDYSVVNEAVGFAPEELSALEELDAVSAVAAIQLSLYEIDENGAPAGIDTGFTLQPGETFQTVGLNDVYCDAFFDSYLTGEVLERLKAGEGCIVRNPLPLVFNGEEIARTEIRAGSSIAVAGTTLPVLATLDGYDSGYISVGNSGFVNGVQVIVTPERYAQLTGKTEYQELKPILRADAQREAFDAVLDALAQRTPGTTWLSYEDTDRQAAESFAQIRLLAWGLILFVGLIGLLNIVNTVYTNIHTRVVEIGMQRAIGMSAGSLYKVFLWEGAYYGVIAAAAGSIIGYAGVIFTQAVAENAIQLAAFPLVPALEAAALAMGVCLLATCIPLRRISRMDIVDSIEAAE